MDRMNSDVEQFWAGIEARYGEKVLIFALGRCLSALDGPGSGEQGLFFLTETRLFFYYFPGEKKVLSIPIGSAKKQDPLIYSFLRENFRDVEVLYEPSFLKKLFFPQRPEIRIVSQNASGKKELLRFSLEMKQEEFLDLLHLG